MARQASKGVSRSCPLFGVWPRNPHGEEILLDRMQEQARRGEQEAKEVTESNVHCHGIDLADHDDLDVRVSTVNLVAFIFNYIIFEAFGF